VAKRKALTRFASSRESRVTEAKPSRSAISAGSASSARRRAIWRSKTASPTESLPRELAGARDLARDVEYEQVRWMAAPTGASRDGASRKAARAGLVNEHGAATPAQAQVDPGVVHEVDERPQDARRPGRAPTRA
jgi:hypothetical protein